MRGIILSVGPSSGPTHLFAHSGLFLDATTSASRFVGPSVSPSVRRSVLCYFRMTNMAIFEDKKSSNDIINNDTMGNNEIVASYVPPRYLFSFVLLFFSFF